MVVVFLTDFITVSVCRCATRYAPYLACIPFICFDMLKPSKNGGDCMYHPLLTVKSPEFFRVIVFYVLYMIL